MTETEKEIFDRVCKTGEMTKPTHEYDGLTPEEVLEKARIKEKENV